MNSTTIDNNHKVRAQHQRLPRYVMKAARWYRTSKQPASQAGQPDKATVTNYKTGEPMNTSNVSKDNSAAAPTVKLPGVHEVWLYDDETRTFTTVFRGSEARCRTWLRRRGIVKTPTGLGPRGWVWSDSAGNWYALVEK